jgi:hypothetical protein
VRLLRPRPRVLLPPGGRCGAAQEQPPGLAEFLIWKLRQVLSRRENGVCNSLFFQARNSVISALGRQRQKDGEFEDRLGYIARSWFTKKQNKTESLSSLAQRRSHLHLLFVYSFIHMCIHCLGRFSHLSLSPSPQPYWLPGRTCSALFSNFVEEKA